MNTLLDNLFARRPKIHYVCPPICGVQFVPTSSGAPAVSFDPVSPLGCVDYAIFDSTLRWNDFPGAICYNVYYSPPLNPTPPEPPVPPEEFDFYTTVPATLPAGEIGFYAYGPMGFTELEITFETIIPSFYFWPVPDLVTLSFPNLTGIDPLNLQGGGLYCVNCTLLANVSLPVFLPRNGMTIRFDGCALTEASVDGILARCIANAAFVSGTVNLSGGTNAVPSATGATNAATLVVRGVTVTTN